MSKEVILQSGEKKIAIKVPLVAFGFDVNNYGDSSELMYMIPIESMESCSPDETLKTLPLPKGNWKIIHKPQPPK